MNQIRFMITATLVSLMITSGIASSSAASALITPLQKTMTLEQLLLWIQQYNLNHPENPIVLDMNTILSAPPQQIKTIIETHINTVTHSNNNNNDDDDDNGDNHNHHHKFNWNDLFNDHDGNNQQHNDWNGKHGIDGNDPRQKEIQIQMQQQQQQHDNYGKVDFSGGKDDLTNSDDDNPTVSSDSDSGNSDDSDSSDSGDSGSSDGGGGGSDSGSGDSGGSDSGSSDSGDSSN